MITRKQYMNKEYTFDEYYLQFVDSGVIARVSAIIGKDRVAKSRDPAFNDISMNLWDAVMAPFPKYIGDKLRECGDYPTLAGAVCIAKRAAKELLK